MAGLSNKDKGVWDSLKNWNAMVLSETWVEEEGWGRIKEKLLGGFILGWQAATREHVKGRARGEWR